MPCWILQKQSVRPTLECELFIRDQNLWEEEGRKQIGQKKQLHMIQAWQNLGDPAVSSGAWTSHQWPKCSPLCPCVGFLGMHNQWQHQKYLSFQFCRLELQHEVSARLACSLLRLMGSNLLCLFQLLVTPGVPEQRLYSLCLFFFFFWLCWVFLLWGLFSNCSKCRLLSSCGVQASHCCDFSCCRARALEHRLSSCGTWA